MPHADGQKLPAGLLAALVLCLPFTALASDPPLRVVDAVDLTQRDPMVRGRRLPNSFRTTARAMSSCTTHRGTMGGLTS
jgi:hypothetical protein